jgi:AcrR family transcriptional regulator
MQAARMLAGWSMMVNGEPGHSRGRRRPAGGRRTQAERSATTRAALVSAATELFAAKGYAAAGREEIVAAAGLTRGALYHHFADKAALFRAVFEAVEAQVMARVAEAAMAVEDPLAQLQRGCHAYLEAARDPGVRRICIIDAPAVLDEQIRREIATDNALGMVREALEAAIVAGRIPDQPVDAAAHVLLATVMAAAQYVAVADDPDRASRDVAATIDTLLRGLTTTET